MLGDVPAGPPGPEVPDAVGVGVQGCCGSLGFTHPILGDGDADVDPLGDRPADPSPLEPHADRSVRAQSALTAYEVVRRCERVGMVMNLRRGAPPTGSRPGSSGQHVWEVTAPSRYVWPSRLG
jgi:hypothetical protein